ALAIGGRAAALERGGRMSGRIALSNVRTMEEHQNRSQEAVSRLKMLHAGDRHIELADATGAATLNDRDPNVRLGLAALRTGLVQSQVQYLLRLQIFGHVKLALVLTR